MGNSEMQEHPIDDELIPIEVVLKMVGVSKNSWYGAIRRGEAPRAVKPLGGRRSLWHRSEVRSMIDAMPRSGESDS